MKLKKALYILTHWETWNYLAKYIPIMPVWIWYCIRARSLWFFTPSNPSINFGGFEGEGKKEMYSQLPPDSFPKTIYIQPENNIDDVKSAVLSNNFIYPFAVKPNVGMMGFMFRKINNENELFRYHQQMPVEYIIQDFVDYPIEVSVFYYRFPNQTKGHITGFLKKEFLQVTGDGKCTLGQLIEAYPSVQFRLPEMRSKHADKLKVVIAKDKVYFLSFALNLSRGGKLVSLAHQKDDALLEQFDKISNYTRHFFYGRYDIKCASVEDLKAGKNFSILEYNGCGAEPHHIYGNGNSLLQAYKIVLQHWKVLYRISRYNHHNGSPAWSFKRGWQFLKEAKKHFKKLKQLDMEFNL